MLFLAALLSFFACVLPAHPPHLCAFFLSVSGANNWGQLGRGDTNATGDNPDEMGDKLIVVNLGTGEVAADMALGEEHTCVMLESGDSKVRVCGVREGQ